MTTPSVMRNALRECDGFRLESPDGPIGWVEEVWLGAADEPSALAVRTIDGRRGLLTAGDVVAVVPEHEWVVVSSQARLLELDVPRVEVLAGSRTGGSRPAGRRQARRSLLRRGPERSAALYADSGLARRPGRAHLERKRSASVRSGRSWRCYTPVSPS